MFSNYVTTEEFYRLGTDRNKRIVKEDDAAAALAAATHQIMQDLRNRRYDLSRLQIPRMFDSIHRNQTVTYGDRTSGAIEVDGENRFVVDFQSTDPAVFTLEGSYDGITFTTVYNPYSQEDDKAVRLLCNERKRYSTAFSDAYRYYRYVLSDCASTVTYAAFMVDTALDMLFVYRAVMISLFSRLSDNDDVITAVYREAKQMYESLMSGLVLNYDMDGDGVPDKGVVMRRVAWQ
jgi:hypothetical protein